MKFEDYYTKKFEHDLRKFYATMPEGMRKHFSRSPESYSISMNFLVEPDLALKVIPLEDRPSFAVCLYFTALVDQSMHYHFRQYYERFERMTNYPKLTGACPGACMYMAHPTIALKCTNLFNSDPSEYINSRNETIERSQAILKPIVEEGIVYFLKDFPQFLRTYFPEIPEPESFARRVFCQDYTVHN
jgi:hypothetical protein